jgi:hypothetical protein
MEQIMEMLARMDVNQPKTSTDLRETREEMMARLEAMIENNKEKPDANLKEIRSGQENLKEKMKANQESDAES